jgi:hypothetical protein
MEHLVPHELADTRARVAPHLLTILKACAPGVRGDPRETLRPELAPLWYPRKRIEASILTREWSWGIAAGRPPVIREPRPLPRE